MLLWPIFNKINCKEDLVTFSNIIVLCVFVSAGNGTKAEATERPYDYDRKVEFKISKFL
jgi:hypothetical protein